MSVLDSISSWLASRRHGRLVVCLTESEYQWRLDEIWNPPPPAPVSDRGSEPFPDDSIRFSRKRPLPLDWKIAFTSVFTKAVAAAACLIAGHRDATALMVQ